MNKKLREFVAEHPEFFEKVGDCFVLKKDIHFLVEQYARMVDAEEFERVRQLVASIQKDNYAELEQEIQTCQNEIGQKKIQMNNLIRQLDLNDEEMHLLQIEMARTKEMVARKSKGDKPFYYSSSVFWLLASIGVGFMYVGFFISISGATTFLLVGFLFFMASIVVQGWQGASHPPIGAWIDTFKLEIEALESKQHILKVRRATFLQQKNVAKEAIDNLERNIRNCKHKINILNG
jgi:hypothetical protein